MKKKEKPSILKMVKNFVKESVTFIKEGAPVCSEEEYKERITLCSTCDQYNEKKQTCNICGCFMPAKAGWKTSVCPDTPPKWHKLIGQKEEDKFMEKQRGVEIGRQRDLALERRNVELLRRQVRKSSGVTRDYRKTRTSDNG